MEQSLNGRQRKMLEILKKYGHASVKSLSESFFVSEMTVRRDLKMLEQLGLVQRYSGGAAYDVQQGGLLPLKQRRYIHADAKKKLSSKVGEYLHDGMTVYIDSSSTCLYILPALSKYRDILLVTNSVQCASAAAKYNISCKLAGGDYFARDMCTVGGETVEFVSGIYSDVAFFSVKGMSDDGIMSDPDEQQTLVRRAAMKSSAVKVFVFDSSKLNSRYTYTVCTADDADEIIIL